jgi:myo-inositol 2-dehydrogenase / D-chiro-inositol 1-dehydrogenase
MMKKRLNRRTFLAGTAAAGAAMSLPAASYARVRTANDKVRIAFLGVGGRCQQHIDVILEMQHKGLPVEGIAVCDVWDGDPELGSKKGRGLKPSAKRCGIPDGAGKDQISKDYRTILENKNVDVVCIATPDHWHAIIALSAVSNGKDVYCEKPLTLTVAEGQALVRVARETGRVLQTGSQQRSEFSGRFRLACELVRNGRIGRVQTIETRIGRNPVGGPFQTRAVPHGLDWNMWLGPTPMVDYIPERCHYEFRWWYEYSGGKMTDWGAHHNDVAQWALGMDSSGPVEVEATSMAAAQGNRSYNCHPQFRVTYTYANGTNGANGTRLVCTSEGENGVHFAGENGRWIFVSRGAIRASAPEILNEALPQNAVRLEVSNNHMANFISCVRSRRQPICHAEVGHRSCTVCHIGTIAIRVGGGRLRWNPEQERFVDNDAANRWLSRDMRAPWRLEA